MILLDANILLYAVDAGSPRHEAARTWLDGTLSEGAEVGFPLVSLLAFLRIGTDPRVFRVPLESHEALDIVRGWLARPRTRIVVPTRRHWDILGEVAGAGRVRGPSMTDAHLAALAKEHGSSLCTTDRDFARFPDLDLIDPTA